MANVMITVGAIEEGGVIGIRAQPEKPMAPRIDSNITAMVIPTAVLLRRMTNSITIIMAYIAGINVITSRIPASLKASFSITIPLR